MSPNQKRRVRLCRRWVTWIKGTLFYQLVSVWAVGVQWKHWFVAVALPLATPARAALVSLDQDGERSSVAAQPRRLYITNVSSWRLLISQVSIGGLCREDQSGVANQWGHFILLERLLFDPRHWLVELTPRLWGCFFFFLLLLVFLVMKRSGWRVMNTLVLAACWASRGWARHMCGNPVVFPLHCQEPTDLAQRFDSNLHSYFGAHNSIMQIRRPKSSQSFPGLPPVSRQPRNMCNLCKNCERSLYSTGILVI